MSIEQTFERIASALERLADAQGQTLELMGATPRATAPADDKPHPKNAPQSISTLKRTGGKTVKVAEAPPGDDDLADIAEAPAKPVKEAATAPAKLTFTDDIKPIATRLAEAKGRGAIVDLLTKEFNFAEGQKVSALTEDQYAKFIELAKGLLGEK